MHVVLANLYWRPDWESPERVAHPRHGDRVRGPLARALAARGHSVTIVQDAPFDADFHDPASPAVRWVLVRAEPSARAKRSLAATARRPFPLAHARPGRFTAAVAAQAGSVIHGFDLCAYSAVAALGAVANQSRIPMVLHFHGGAPPRSPPGRLRARDALDSASAALFTARSLADPFLSAGLLEPDRVFEVNELSTDFGFVAETRPGLAGRPVVVSLGRLDKVKDPLTTVEGFARFRQAVPGAHLHLAYTGDTLLPALRKRFAALGLAGSVTLHGRLDLAGVESMLGRAHLFVQSSTREVCGTAVVEALAAGCPPVVTDIPAFRTLLGPALAHHLFAVRNPGALAAALSRAWSSSSRKSARARFDQATAWPVLAEQLEQLYGSVSPRSPGTNRLPA